MRVGTQMEQDQCRKTSFVVHSQRRSGLRVVNGEIWQQCLEVLGVNGFRYLCEFVSVSKFC